MSKISKIEELKLKIQSIYKDEYSLLSTEYKNARTKIDIRHNVCGTIFSMRVDAFLGKQRQQCPNKQCVKSRIEQTNLNKYGYKCILSSPEFRDKIKDTMIQKYGTDSFFKDGLIQNKMNEKYGISSSNQINIDKQFIDILHNYNLLKQWSENFYKQNNKMPNILDFVEESHYDVTNVYKVIKDNDWELSNFFNLETSSQYEQIIKNFLDENNISYFLHSKNIIPPLEIDFFLPQYNIGIEVNGICCHSSSQYYNFIPKSKYYHQEKSLQCERNGIRLSHICEWELLPENRSKIINFLKNVLNINVEKIYARKCDIVRISNIDANNFYEAYHLQGKTSNSQYNYGLLYKNELIACMTFSLKKDIYTLSRFCTKGNYRVIGGASKLFLYFVRQYQPKTILSFSDITKMSGMVYEKLGFSMEKIISPSYWWVKRNNIVYWRRDCQKQYMHKIYGFDKNYKYKEHKEDAFWQRTEKEIMEDMGYFQIFDSGMRRHIWKNNKEEI